MNCRTFSVCLTVTTILFSCGFLTGCGSQLTQRESNAEEVSVSRKMPNKVNLKPLQKSMKQVHDLHQPFKETSWSKRNKDEKLQSLESYIQSDPNRPGKQQTTLYLQPIGEFTKTQTKVMKATVDLLSRQFGVPVKMLPTLKLDVIPAKARRVHPSWGMKQILSTYVLNDLLKPRRPKNAVAVLAMTTSDLWPGDNWNFVFGQASLRERVGVWSLYRYGNPDKSKEAYQKYLLRTLKVATHETGHMLGIPHCVAYQCGMNGSNSLSETDEGPLAFCPQCAAKLWWATKRLPKEWYQDLAEFAEKQKLKEEAKFWKKCQHAVDEK